MTQTVSGFFRWGTCFQDRDMSILRGCTPPKIHFLGVGDVEGIVLEIKFNKSNNKLKPTIRGMVYSIHKNSDAEDGLLLGLSHPPHYMYIYIYNNLCITIGEWMGRIG